MGLGRREAEGVGQMRRREERGMEGEEDEMNIGTEG